MVTFSQPFIMFTILVSIVPNTNVGGRPEHVGDTLLRPPGYRVSMPFKSIVSAEIGTGGKVVLASWGKMRVRERGGRPEVSEWQRGRPHTLSSGESVD